MAITSPLASAVVHKLVLFFCAVVRVFEFNFCSVDCVVTFCEISASSAYGMFSFHQFVFPPALRFRYFRINENQYHGTLEREREREKERERDTHTHTHTHTLSYGMP